MHHSEAHVSLRVSSISKFVFVEDHLSIVKDRVVLAQHVYWYLWNLRAFVKICGELLLLRYLTDDLVPYFFGQLELLVELC